MAKRKPETEVGSYAHPEAKRKNIPTAETERFMADEEAAPKRLRWPRNPDLDPQLVWRGKDWQGDLEVPVVPVYIQEKIHPQAIIEDLRRQTAARAQEVAGDTPDLFADFNGLPDLEAKLEFYQHDQHWSNRMILGDSLLVMASLAEKEGLKGKVQMIYMDPPYGIKFNSNWQPSTKTQEVKEGQLAYLAQEPEVIKAFRDTWNLGVSSYLAYFSDRIISAHSLLTDSGSIIIQIGDANVHRLRVILDTVFGDENFVSSISLVKSSGSTENYLASATDYLLWYAKDISKLKYRQLYKLKEIGGEGSSKYTRLQCNDLSRRPASEIGAGEILNSAGRLYRQDNLTSQSIGRQKGEGAASWFPVEIRSKQFLPSISVRWKTNQEGMSRLIKADRIESSSNSLHYIRFIDDFKAFEMNNVWADIGGVQSRSDPKIYVVQTSRGAVER